MSDLELELKEKIKQARAEQEESLQSEIGDVEEPIEEVQEEVVEEVEEEPTENDIDEPEEEEDDLELDEEQEKNPKAKNAFQKMRQELKERDAAIEEMRREMAKLQGMQEAMLKPQEEAPQVEQEPDKDLEPEEWVAYQLKQRDKQIEELTGKFDAITQQTATSQAEAAYINLESDYTKKDASYNEAKAYYVNERTRQLKAQYPAATDEQIKQEVKFEEYKLVESLAKAGFQPDDIFTTIKAKAINMGYKENIPTPKRDNKKLKHNMSKSASLNDAPSANGEIGFSENQLKRMSKNFSEVGKLAKSKGDMKKAHDALRIARLKAYS
jgi:DNA repair exonuclease SbcCD ATPase subunit